MFDFKERAEARMLRESKLVEECKSNKLLADEFVAGMAKPFYEWHELTKKTDLKLFLEDCGFNKAKEFVFYGEGWIVVFVRHRDYVGVRKDGWEKSVIYPSHELESRILNSVGVKPKF